jgi:uncharacterized protein YqiB (DUF1249 family)
MALLLTTRDEEIFDALTRRVRVFSLAQIARTWWSSAKHPTRAAEQRLRLLARDGLIESALELAHPELELEKFVASWAPGEEMPNFGSVSFKLQSRWREHPVRTRCVSATDLAARRFGGYGGRPPRAVERTHDIHFARVFLLYRERHPDLIRAWIFEEQVKAERRQTLQAVRSRSTEKLPDAFLRLSSGARVVEFGGAYDKAKLQAFHHYCEEKSYPYEIW